MKKRATALTLCLIVLLGTISAPALAMRWAHVSSIQLVLGYNPGTETVTWQGDVRGNTGTTYIEAAFTLEKHLGGTNYQFINSWMGDSSTTKLFMSNSYGNLTTGTYRLTVTGSVTIAGVAETFTTSQSRTF